ncbi:hypothetical protein R3P38DRAFT_2870931 [Favolaschia claudopus]|uniref:Yeast cell wall synthesis Kre9/Knh1-like N-terminal domain-containing protein n=1 Tax=Favolaschia claudopus TaxID=2862362 RepID=A0AAW0DDI9_9AGAR
MSTAFFKIWAILLLAIPFVSALDIIELKGNAVSGGQMTVTWRTSNSDPAGAFSIVLFHDSFHDQFAVATNVDASGLSKDFVIPIVPTGDNYFIQFIDIFNVNQVFSTSNSFSIGAESATQSVTVHESSIKTSSTTSASLTSSSSSTGSAPSAPSGGSPSSPTSAPPSASSPSASNPAPTGAALPTHSTSLTGVLAVALGVALGAFAL